MANATNNGLPLLLKKRVYMSKIWVVILGVALTVNVFAAELIDKYGMPNNLDEAVAVCEKYYSTEPLAKPLN